MTFKYIRNQGIIITGPQGSGKSALAQELANASLYTSTTTMDNIRKPFGLSFLANKPDVVIVEECWLTPETIDIAKQLVSNNKIQVDRKGRSPITVDAPNFIFVSGSSEPLNLDAAERRFMVIEVK